MQRSGLQEPDHTLSFVSAQQYRGRHGALHSKGKCRFLWIAKASCGELRTQLIVGKEIGYISESLAAAWIIETRELSKMLCGLINKISD